MVNNVVEVKRFPFIHDFIEAKENREYRFYPNGILQPFLVVQFFKQNIDVDLDSEQDLASVKLKLTTTEELITRIEKQLSYSDKDSLFTTLVKDTICAFGEGTKVLLSTESDEIGAVCNQSFFCLFYVEESIKPLLSANKKHDYFIRP